MTLAIDFFTANKSDAATDTLPDDKAVSIARSEPTPIPDDDKGAADAAMDIVNFLIPKRDEEDGDGAPSAGEKKTTADAPNPEARPDVRQNPVVHPAQLIQLAESWGITADQAANYQSQEALLGAVAIRELRYRKATESRDGKNKETEKPVADDLAPPEIPFDEDDDPKVKAVAKAAMDYTAKVKDRTSKEVAELREQVAALTQREQQAAERDARSEEAKIAVMFDEKVASWGDEFIELLGVPQQSWKETGSPQHAEVKKLRNYVLRSRLGYEEMTGQSPSMDDIAAFIDEARGALWPQHAKKAARSEIAAKVKRQSGGAGLRVGATGRDEKPAQGDVAAKRGISDFLTGIGMNPWATPRT